MNFAADDYGMIRRRVREMRLRDLCRNADIKPSCYVPWALCAAAGYAPEDVDEAKAFAESIGYSNYISDAPAAPT